MSYFIYKLAESYSSTNYCLCIELCNTYIYSRGKVVTIRIYTVSDLWLVQRCFKQRVIGSFLMEKVDQTAIFMGTRTKPQRTKKVDDHVTTRDL